LSKKVSNGWKKPRTFWGRKSRVLSSQSLAQVFTNIAWSFVSFDLEGLAFVGNSRAPEMQWFGFWVGVSFRFLFCWTHFILRLLLCLFQLGFICELVQG
jgi:hypothetical protein